MPLLNNPLRVCVCVAVRCDNGINKQGGPRCRLSRWWGVMYNAEKELGVYTMSATHHGIGDFSVIVPGTTTTSLFLVLNRTNFTSSSPSSSSPLPNIPSTVSPACLKKLHTSFATSSALLVPFLLPVPSPFMLLSAASRSTCEGSVAVSTALDTAFRLMGSSGAVVVEVETRPEARTTAPVERERMSVLLTPGFWARRVRRRVVSSGYFEHVNLSSAKHGVYSVRSVATCFAECSFMHQVIAWQP